MGFQFQCPKGHMLEADPSSIGQASACPFCGTQFLIPAPVAPTPTLPHGASGPHPGFAPPNRPQPHQAFPPQPYYPQQPAPAPSAGMAGPAINVGSAGSMAAPTGPLGALPTVGPAASRSGRTTDLPAVGPANAPEGPSMIPGLPQIQRDGQIQLDGQAPRATGPAGSPAKEEVLLHIPCPNGHELEVPSEMLEQEALCPTCQVQFRLRAKDSVEHKRRQQEAYERRQYKLGQAWLNWSVGIAVVVVLGLLTLIVVKMSR